MTCSLCLKEITEADIGTTATRRDTITNEAITATSCRECFAKTGLQGVIDRLEQAATARSEP
jgi:hypothetical protein